MATVEVSCEQISVAVDGENITVDVSQEGPQGPPGENANGGPPVDITGKADKVGTADIEITDATKGVILTTADDTRVRLTIVKNEFGEPVIQLTAL